ncbi:excisionase family DNA-binding protein [Streptomyces huiliensis]|uniref:excisionase family DNA-binding protein n=1 Tax=Streptomyces huiliensis TaxID=2876027 RepID=UPI001CBB98BA|nr:excisionase family DNA-binding protein [Streptomyces huiliensis]
MIVNQSEGTDETLAALTVEEAARRLSIGRTLMFRLLSQGAVKSVVIGRLRRVPVEALREYLTALSTSDMA